MSQIRDPVSIIHGYGDTPEITVDGNQIHGVKSYVVRGAAGSLPEVTVTFEARFVTFREKETSTTSST